MATGKSVIAKKKNSVGSTMTVTKGTTRKGNSYVKQSNKTTLLKNPSTRITVTKGSKQKSVLFKKGGK